MQKMNSPSSFSVLLARLTLIIVAFNFDLQKCFPCLHYATALMPEPCLGSLMGRRIRSTHRSTVCKMSIQPTFDNIFNRVKEQFGLVQTDFCDVLNVQTWQSADGASSGSNEWWTEANPRFLTGVSKVTRRRNKGTDIEEEFTINIWMGPSYDVPHLLLSVGQKQQGQYALLADYIPRGMTPLGSDPQYLEKYFGDDVDQWWNKVCTNANQFAPPQRSSMASRIIQALSPARISVLADSKAIVEEASAEHVDRFLKWIQREAPSPIPARLRGSFNSRDDKLRQYFYRGELERHVAELGQDLGGRVAAGGTGPISEAYVGGGS